MPLLHPLLAHPLFCYKPENSISAEVYVALNHRTPPTCSNIRKEVEQALLEGSEQYPDHPIRLVGHSLGGGTAAILTMM